MNLNKEESKELKALYSKLSELYKERARIEVLKRSREEQLKFEIAGACNVVDKKGQVQSSKVKMPLVIALIDELYKDLPNKENLKADTMESYKLALKNKEVNTECVKAFMATQTSLKENAEDIKEAYKESSLLSKEILDALNALCKDEFKLYVNDELTKQGFEVKESKDKSELLELKEMLKSLID